MASSSQLLEFVLRTQLPSLHDSINNALISSIIHFAGQCIKQPTLSGIDALSRLLTSAYKLLLHWAQLAAQTPPMTTMKTLHGLLCSALTALLGHGREVADGGSSSSGSSGQEHRQAHMAEQMVQKMHHLLALTVMVLVWLDNHQKRGGREEWRASHAPATCLSNGWVAELKVTIPELADVALALTLPETQPASWKSESACFQQEAVAWDGYAIQHFHGRLLPGCSYLGCINLKGSSEGTLVTHLCGGCRRTRYCSVECQRSAWGVGGHADVCGNGMWDVGHVQQLSQ